ncbi:MAG: ATP-binding protein [Syntrophales bacterium]
MKHFDFASLRFKLILLIVIILLPMFAYSLYGSLEAQRRVRDDAFRAALDEANKISITYAEIINHTRTLFATISHASAVQQLDRTASKRFLADLQRDNSKLYSVINIVLPNGDLYVTSLPTTQKANYADRSWFRPILQDRSFTLGEYLIGRLVGKPILSAVGPILDDEGNLKAILLTGINLDALDISRERGKLPDGSDVTVFDQKGVVLMRHPAGAFVGKAMPEVEIVRKAQSLKVGTVEARGVDEKGRLYGFTKLGQARGEIYVSVGIPVEIVFAGVRRMMITQFSVLGVIALLAFSGAWWLGNRHIGNPIKRLLMATRRVAEGDLAVRTSLVKYGGEIGELATEFDKMADSLQGRDSALKKALAENEHLIKNLEGIVGERTGQLEAARMQAEAAAITNKDIIDSIREPLLVLDSDLRVLSANRSFYNYFQVRPEETIGNLIYDLGNRQWDIPKLRTLLEKMLSIENNFDDYEIAHDFSNIGRRIMLLNARRITHKEIHPQIILLAIEDITEKKILLGIEDITERREIENGLEKARKELAVIKIAADEVSEYAESLINAIREPLIALDQDLRVVTASRSFYNFFKVNPEDTVGQLIYDLGNKQWDIPKLRELLETILPQKTTFDDYEVEHDFATIGRRTMLLNARQIQRVLGKERIILLAIEDITERREIENGLEKAHEELKELATELKRTTRVKSEFLANMSHELRTPLNAIIGFSEVLEDGLYGDLNDRQKTYAHHIYNAGKHLLSLINDILDLSKVEAGKMEFEVSRFPIRAVLNSSVVMLKEKAIKHGIALSVEVEPDADIHVDADERKIKQILFNLLSNAVKFTPDGGKVTVRARMAAVKNGSDQRRMLEVCIEDTGIGIKEEDLPRLFGEFTQLHQTILTKVYEGTGLGLALTKRLVGLHHGSIRVESEYGKGSRFYFTLPTS